MKHLKSIEKEKIIMEGLIACLAGFKLHNGYIWTAVASKGHAISLHKNFGIPKCVSHVIIACNSRQEADVVVAEMFASGLEAESIAYLLPELAYRLALSDNGMAILIDE